MADNTIAITAGSGTNVRTITNAAVDGGAHQQVVSLADAAGNTLGTTATPLPVAPPPSTLAVTATGAANAAVTATLPAAGAGLFHYITAVQIQKFMTAAGTGAGTAVLTSGANHSLVWNQPTDAAAIGTLQTVVDYRPTAPLRSTTANTATTFITAAVASTIYRINVTYYTGT